MKYNLADSLRVILPGLSPVLVSDEFKSRILKLSSHLPPLPWCGFECHLDAKNPQTDFHQGFQGDPETAEILGDHLARMNYLSAYPWNQILDFFTEWSTPASLLNKHIPMIVMEYDIKKTLSRPPVPAVFLTIKKPEPVERFGREFKRVTKTALGILMDQPVAQKLGAALDVCVRAAPRKSFIYHTGLMLSRSPEIIRINFVGSGFRHLKSFLEQLHWQGSMEALESIHRRYGRFAEQVVLDVDMGEKPRTDIGLEFHTRSGSPITYVRPEFLDHLVKHGLCAPEKRDALVSWPGMIGPDLDCDNWPGHFILESMTRPPDRFSALKKELSHVKLTLWKDNSVTAKAYLGFSHVFAVLNSEVAEKTPSQ